MCGGLVSAPGSVHKYGCQTRLSLGGTLDLFSFCCLSTEVFSSGGTVGKVFSSGGTVGKVFSLGGTVGKVFSLGGTVDRDFACGGIVDYFCRF